MTNYDPNKRYTWAQEDKFELNGRDFGLILNTLRAILSTEEAARIMLAQQASASLEGCLARAVEQGTAKEVVEDEPVAPPQNL